MDTLLNLNKPVLVAVMGATGTGKSTFIKQLTGDSKISIGHDQQSETFDIQTAYYIDRNSGRLVVLIDTPGFDDSRKGITDTDILEKIVSWLEPGSSKGRKLNGIIYMHRISDPRVGGVSRKNLRMFRLLCGADQLGNVRIVTTNWDRVTTDEGNHREVDLKEGAFKALLDCGAKMCRHANSVDSARKVMSELVLLQPVTLQIQDELHEGKKLSETAASMELNREMRELEEKLREEMKSLRKEMEAAAQTHDRALRAELAQERRVLEEKAARIEADRERLEKTLDEQRREFERQVKEEKDRLQKLSDSLEKERQEMQTQMARARDSEQQFRNQVEQRQYELQQEIINTQRRILELQERSDDSIDFTKVFCRLLSCFF